MSKRTTPASKQSARQIALSCGRTLRRAYFRAGRQKGFLMRGKAAESTCNRADGSQGGELCSDRKKRSREIRDGDGSVDYVNDVGTSTVAAKKHFPRETSRNFAMSRGTLASEFQQIKSTRSVFLSRSESDPPRLGCFRAKYTLKRVKHYRDTLTTASCIEVSWDLDSIRGRISWRTL